MKKKITIIVLIIIAIAVSICKYYFFTDIESTIPTNIAEDIKIETKNHMFRNVFTISPEEKSEKVILYFHGGAYMAEMTDNHWNFLQKLARDTKATIIVPDYPLTPKYTYKDVLEMSNSFYRQLINKVDSNNLILMGDSAGGGLALGLSEYLRNNNIQLPAKTILISPWLDIKVKNPEIKKVQPNDKDLSKFKLYIAGFCYSRGFGKKDKYFANPIEGDLSNLNNITIYTGTYDILNPDCYVLQEKAKKVGTEIQIKEYKTAPHIWIVNNSDDLAKKAYDDLILRIGE